MIAYIGQLFLPAMLGAGGVFVMVGVGRQLLRLFNRDIPEKMK